MSLSPWMKLAWRDYGVREIAGSRHSRRILDYFADVGHDGVRRDETAWCAAFVGSCLERAGFSSTRSLMARSYLEWGSKLAEPVPGAIAILSRGANPAYGHVGFFVAQSDGKVWLLGGNQSDGVNVAGYRQSRVLGYRWPPKAPDYESLSLRQFGRALGHVLEMEGGWTNDPADPGGATNKGITIADYAAFRGEKLTAASRAGLIDDLRRISDADVRAIYLRGYWQPSRAAELPPPLGLMHFDAAVNHGLGGAARMLQQAVGEDIDGEIGPLTVRAAHRRPVEKSLAAYAAIRRQKYRALHHFNRFGRGWLARVAATLEASQRLTVAPINHETGREAIPKETREMQNEPKWWGQSLTIWGTAVTAISTVLPLVAPMLGFEVTSGMVQQLGGQVTELLQVAGGIFGTVMTVYGRVRAGSRLKRRNFNLTF